MSQLDGFDCKEKGDKNKANNARCKESILLAIKHWQIMTFIRLYKNYEKQVIFTICKLTFR
jgi:hypothetical protein